LQIFVVSFHKEQHGLCKDLWTIRDKSENVGFQAFSQSIDACYLATYLSKEGSLLDRLPTIMFKILFDPSTVAPKSSHVFFDEYSDMFLGIRLMIHDFYRFIPAFAQPAQG